MPNFKSSISMQSAETKGDSLSFVVMAPNAWDRIWMNRQHLFSRLGARHEVLYTNGAWFTWDRKKEHYRSQHSFFGCKQRRDNVHVCEVPKYLLRSPRLKRYDQWVLKWFCRWVDKSADPVAPRVLYLFHPCFYEYSRYIQHDVLVYHAYDDFSKQTGARRYLAEERELMENSDLVIASSEGIRARMNQECEREIEVVPNGVDFELFCRPEYVEPSDLAPIPHPRVGYTGRINTKVDLGLFRFLAEKRPNVSFVAIGPIGNLMAEESHLLKAIQQLPNCYFLGQKDVDELPHYMAHLDINTMCYSMDPGIWACNGYPLKLHEYLAVGKPVISSPLSAVCEFSDVVDIAYSAEGWLELIDKNLDPNAICSEKVEARRIVASSNSWDHRVMAIESFVQKLIRKKRAEIGTFGGLKRAVVSP